MHMKSLCIRTIRVLFGLFLFSLGSYLGIQANIGLGAWEAFGVGISGITGLSYGDVIVLSGLMILVIDVLLREKIGVATILNTLLIGKMVDAMNAMNLMPKMRNFIPGLLLMLLGQVIVCLGVYFYVSPGLGAGPRDSLMIALGKRLSKVPIGAVKGAIEGTVLLIGWALGAKIGVGTIISVFGISFIIQGTFRVLRFDVKAVKHENAFQTLKALSRA